MSAQGYNLAEIFIFKNKTLSSVFIKFHNFDLRILILQSIFFIISSVSDPYHFDLDPDPR